MPIIQNHADVSPCYGKCYFLIARQKNLTCCNETSCTLSLSLFLCKSLHRQASWFHWGQTLPIWQIFPCNPSLGVCIFQRYTQLGLLQMAIDLQLSRLALWSLALGPDRELLKAPFSPLSSSALPIPLSASPLTTSSKWLFNNLQNGPYHCLHTLSLLSISLYQSLLVLLSHSHLWYKHKHSSWACTVALLWSVQRRG